ncbi:Dus-domain-containing protein [Fomitiporia mediterranea MF3/22]|uniref:Dus-domain-containing protein n=1 Tax=Fomitiporia mediterranea (strain MF3/22) TaxID=694068 RepID=UPI00044078C3|nr:Dus-domain-containing protein [Fomitiporia mediterranea MF3/22]EJC98568.1 Dus-domain-containing protein [Fomitiporia mediterranea MF3/22]
MPGLLHEELPTKRRKLLGNGLYRDVLGSPKFVVAPMVDQSELPWRILSRHYGAQLVYTPMINARMLSEDKHKSYKEQAFNLSHGEEGSTFDRPLIVQFAANDPDQLLKAAKLVESHCDAVDINFGCPQDIARRGHYGSYLQDDWDLVYRLINTLHENLSIPVTAKFRVFPTVEKTVEYAKMMERAGAQILTCHGRTRDQRGQNTGLADWDKIRAVKQAVAVPVFANGNILFHSDIQRCLEVTGADAVMTAEANLYNPTVLLRASAIPSASCDPDPLSSTNVHPSSAFFTLPDDPGAYLPSTVLAFEYLKIVRALRTPTHTSAIKGHLFKLLRPALIIHTDLRAKLGMVSSKKGMDALLDEYESIIREAETRVTPEIERVRKGEVQLEDLVTVDEVSGLRILPHWLAQPYFRPAKPRKPDATQRPIPTSTQNSAKEGETKTGPLANDAT